ncbi:MIS factor, partial [Psilopogon haemacephalus]|nr:MIS factor [Psilopogon haemacephalus]
MKAALGLLLPCLLLLVPSEAIPRQGRVWERLEPGLGKENFTLQGRAGGSAAPRAKRTAPARPFQQPEPGQGCPQGSAEDGALGWASSSLQPWPLGGLEGPVCRVRVDRDRLSSRHLDVVGVLTQYESGFIKLLSRGTSWHGSSPETFGLCPAGQGAAALQPLKHIREHMVEPGRDRVLVLHLEEVKWEAQVKLWFKLGFQAEVGRSLGELRGALLLFYLGSREGPGAEHPQELLATGTGLSRQQMLCLSRATQYLVLGAAVASITRTAEQLRFQASLDIRRGREGGRDRGGRLCPCPLRLASGRLGSFQASLPVGPPGCKGALRLSPCSPDSPPQAGPEELPSPTAASQANTSSPAADGSSLFLGILTRFVQRVLSSSSEPPTQPSSHHWLDFQVMESLPHQLLNLSEEAALERLVQSEEPSLLLFAQGGGAALEQHLGGWQPEGSVLQLLTGKLQEVLGELRAVPAFQANTGLLQQLLSFCYLPSEGPEAAGGGGLAPGSAKLRTLLLLKALQTVRARWQERGRLQRQNRSARHQAHCRLQELTVDLRDRHFVVMPAVYAANNCEGPCRLPLSTRVPSYSSHTVLLLGMQERGSPLRRPPCCVPVRYSDQLIISLSAQGLEVRKFPNMVAEECGCR